MTSLPPDRSIDSLLALMQAGDIAALDVMARAYAPRLLAVARRRCHQPHDAEDAVQQALLTARDAMRSYRGEGEPLAWLSTLVARSCSRMNERAARVELREPEAIELRCPCEQDPEAQAERGELAQALSDALMALSRTDRLAFLLSVEGLDSVQIAARFSLTHDAVRSRLKRARKVLREALASADTLERAQRTASQERDREPNFSDDQRR